MDVLHKRSVILRWCLAAGITFFLFLLYTAIYATHTLDYSTLVVERWLLNRPITNLDCMFFEWRHLGEVPAMFVITIILGVICVVKGQPKQILFYLVLLLLMGVAFEVVGKKVIRLPLSNTLHSGMTVLTCPQLNNQSFVMHLNAAVGMLGKLPSAPVVQVNWAHQVALMPLSSMQTSESLRSFPGGHAIRWCFVCLTAAWMCWHYIRVRWLAVSLTILLSILAFFGGFMQFYIGSHMISDTIAGYLLGIAFACCAIALLTFHEARSMNQFVSTSSSDEHLETVG
jgi:PAP2 superfamily